MTHIFESRSVNEKWAETLINANGWMVFIRLNDETKYKHKIEDLLTNRDVIKKERQNKRTQIVLMLTSGGLNYFKSYFMFVI
ncbi:hypothetical protein MKS77_17620 [Acinetobacter baumannii]